MHNRRIAFFPPIKYDFVYQRPQALFDKFAEHGDTVYYFEGPFKRGSLNDSTLHYSLDHAVKSLNERQKIVTVSRYFRFFFLSFRLPLSAMDRHVSKWMEAFLGRFVGGNIIAFVQSPLWWKHIRGFPFAKIFYDCIDGYGVLGGRLDRSSYDSTFADVLKHSNKVFATSEALENDVLKHKNACDVIRVPNGVLIDKFEGARAHPEVQGIGSGFETVAGYIGVVHKWIDVELVEYCAENRPRCAFVFVGPCSEPLVRKLKARQNVFFLGKRPHDEIPAFIQSFDVCLNPFFTNEIGYDTNPVKLYEYLSLGKPVVSTNIHELKNFEGLVYAADSREEFLLKLDKAAAEDGDEKAAGMRRSFAGRNTWDDRFEKISEAMT